MESCKSCKFWNGWYTRELENDDSILDRDEIGDCRRKPPTVLTPIELRLRISDEVDINVEPGNFSEVETLYGFPATRGNCWCGEYAARTI